MKRRPVVVDLTLYRPRPRRRSDRPLSAWIGLPLAWIGAALAGLALSGLLWLAGTVVGLMGGGQ